MFTTKMDVKIGFLLFILLAGSFAVPTTSKDEQSDFFTHVDITVNPSRIVGGTQAAEGSVPYMVAMSTGLLIRSFMCGGSIISQRTVLTAAHCIEAAYSFGSLLSTLRVTVGTNHWNTGGLSYTLERNVTHPHYVSSVIKNDIGILILATVISFSDLVQPVPLSFDETGPDVVGRAAGWGRIVHQGAISASLLELHVTTIDGVRCANDVAAAAIEHNIRGVPPIDPQLELCTIHSVNHGMCNGDSGSALVRVDRQQQIGIVSWGIPCARGAPDMFVRVSAYRQWLQENVV